MPVPVSKAKPLVKPLVLAVTGPTAAGKTDLAIQLSECFPIELINMDSAQIYQSMDIGTAKISPELRARYPHHLMDIISPEAHYSVAQFVTDVNDLVAQITQRGNIPLLVGGTMLYYKALIDGLATLPAADSSLRKQLHHTLAQHGHQALRDELSQIDAALAASIQGNDTQRLIRFVEIARLTGRAPSELFAEQQAPASFHFFHIAFFPDNRQWLHQRIEQRFDAMLALGLVDEVRALQRQYTLSAEHPSMRCAGYRQVWQYLAGEYDHIQRTRQHNKTNTAWEEMRERGIFATRQLAKRQLTWLRKIPADIIIPDPLKVDFLTIKSAINAKIDAEINAEIDTPKSPP
ncbi:tRNA (adenosine(37)-N6)-dimethylallyltransferase MiaA [Ostreibacterium oceani]|uniref:tRNA dimethylallyltransferase n=1 Tax=Ostreibacterium oceani TaxID=2654998 RepID=A0A6N7EW01_9GAMM|nr:tRNA (adenosine(37)-N6)-dimethylallyltransferase MiaA [Ostreibacterium oceani]MPV86073.1 tRNA (adenosine(37)-N6)-dimethylallyltransferase MiaA [Ostreibacterium oceani]